MTVLDEFTRQWTLNGTVLLEEQFRILLRPKPWWLPERVWRLLISRLITAEHRT